MFNLKLLHQEYWLSILLSLALLPSLSIADNESNATGSAAYGFSSNTRFHPTIGKNGMVTAQESFAAQAGQEILQQGGNAVDAAVATGFALAVTHPTAGNLGGGGFMIISLPNRDKVVALDFREKAPAAAHRDMFLAKDGNFNMDLSLYSILGTGVPGSVMGLTHALQKYGTMPLKAVLAPAIRLAEQGYPISYAQEYSLSHAKRRLEKDPSSKRYFLQENAKIYRAGDIFIQKDLAKTLKRIAAHGAADFYRGETADLIVAEMENNGGLITHQDLLNYQAVEREVIRGRYRNYDVYSMPPPSSGGIHIIQMLNILEGYDLKKMGHNSADYLHALIETMRRAYADRSEYLGDTDFFPVPIEKLTDKRYAAKLRKSIDLHKASLSESIRPGLHVPYESDQTTHFSVMDKAGGAVSVTTTLNLAYGAGRSVDGAGFLLNNEMDDFSSKAGAPNVFGVFGGKANQIEPGKRPLSSMTPTIVHKDGKPYLLTGSPGGSTIITIVLQIILNVLEFDMNIAEAEAAARIHHQWWPDLIITEKDISIDTLNILKQRGFKLGPIRSIGRTNSIVYQNGMFYGSSDPRGGDPGIATSPP